MPIIVCPSRHPSPVITRSAVLTYSVKPVSFNISPAPGSKLAFKNARNAKPMPPPAPDPGILPSAAGFTFFAITE